jgi:putative transposase
MFATQINQLRQLNKREYDVLRTLCRLTKNLYNVSLYSVRQHFFETGTYLSYKENYHACRTNENYTLLNTDMAQQTLQVVDQDMKSFLGLLRLKKQGFYAQKVRLPHYKEKNGYAELILPRIKVQDGKWAIPMSPAFKRQNGRVWIPFPTNLDPVTIREVKIIPKYDARFFEVHYVYKVVVETITVEPAKALALDLGLNNFVSAIATTGASFVIDGRKLKSINQWYNKENARLQSIKDKQKIERLTKNQALLLHKRNRRVQDHLNKSARIVIDYCLDHQIGTLIVGWNPEMKQEINLGRRNNQSFVQIPFAALRNKLKGLCERYGMVYQEQEESYTSKASFLDLDPIPVYNPSNLTKCTFSGKRIKRGLYRALNGQTVNADVQAAANILRKSNHGCDLREVASGLLASPRRIRVA